MTPDAGATITYDAISMFHSSFDGGGEFSICVIIDPENATSEMDIAVGIDNASEVLFTDIDFADFSTDKKTEWRIYLFNANDPNYGFRFDDIKLSGTVIPEPSSLALLALGGLLAARRRR